MKKELIAHKDPKSPIAEIFRTLRTNIQFMSSQKASKVLLITSTMPGEGKSWVSSNLAVTFAQAGKRVVLVDCDMRKGRLHKIFQLDPVPGLSNYLSGIDELAVVENTDVLKYLKRTEVGNLFVIPAGNVPPNPSELLASEKTTTMLDRLKENFDVIILDGTPCLLVTDSVILSRMADSTIIVTAHKITKKDGLEKTKKMIENVGGKIAGVVLNKVPVNIQKYKSTYYYSSDSKSSSSDSEEYNHRHRTNLSENYNVETKNDITKEKTEDIIKQLDEYLNKNKNN